MVSYLPKSIYWTELGMYHAKEMLSLLCFGCFLCGGLYELLSDWLGRMGRIPPVSFGR